MQDHSHPNCVAMGTQLLRNLQWALASFAQAAREDTQQACAISNIQRNLQELQGLRDEMEAAKRKWLKEVQELSQQQLTLISRLKTL